MSPVPPAPVGPGSPLSVRGSYSDFGWCSVDGVSERIVISYAGKDLVWAEWARWNLEAAGYRRFGSARPDE
jgi:hypothetical protein